jgi:hypothetical protein
MKSKSNVRGEHPCRRIVFSITSHDQGWADDTEDEGTYKGSFTWFDAGLERLVHLDGGMLYYVTLQEPGGRAIQPPQVR